MDKIRYPIFVFIFKLMTMTPVQASIFTSEALPEEIKKEMIQKNTWQEKCPVSLKRLRLIKFSYYNFEGQERHDGELIILDAACERALEIFKTLHERKFPLKHVRRIEHYDGSDEASMDDNNSSCFNCREITGGGLPSLHAYGLAIDINPVQNPYYSPGESPSDPVKVLPYAGRQYVNRTNIRPGMVEEVREIFAHNGFSIWGGTWNDPIDWQHFQPSRAVAELLASMNPEDARRFFEMYAKQPKMLNSRMDEKDRKRLINLYEKNPSDFMEYLKSAPDILTIEPKDAIKIMSINFL